MGVESTQIGLGSKAESAEGVKRKALSDEIMALEKRQKTVQCAMMSMNKDADTLSEQAKAQNDMTHSVRASQSAERHDPLCQSKPRRRMT